MGRSRKRQRRVIIPRMGGTPAAASPAFTPSYVSVQRDPDLPEPAPSGPPADAPVLPLDGLEPWAEIRGPALLLEEPPAAAESGLTFENPDQLELEPWSPERDVAAVEAVLPPPAERAAPEAPPALTDTAAAPAPAAEPSVGAPPTPDPVEALYIEARIAAEEGRVAEAMALYRRILESYPQHLRSRNNLALLLDASGDHQGALAELDRALEKDPEHTTLLTNRGALLGALGRYAAAERDLRRVLRVEPANGEALFNLGVVMTKKGLWGEAVPHLRRVTELACDHAAAFYYLGEALNHVDDLLGALEAYLRATELQPQNARALYGLGIIYDRLARPDEAALMYRKSREVARR